MQKESQKRYSTKSTNLNQNGMETGSTISNGSSHINRSDGFYSQPHQMYQHPVVGYTQPYLPLYIIHTPTGSPNERNLQTSSSGSEQSLGRSDPEVSQCTIPGATFMLPGWGGAVLPQHMVQYAPGQQHPRSAPGPTVWRNPWTQGGPRSGRTDPLTPYGSPSSATTNPETDTVRIESYSPVTSPHSYYGTGVPPEVRGVQPVWGQLLPMYQQLYPAPYGGSMCPQEQSLRSMSVPIQSSSTKIVPESTKTNADSINKQDKLDESNSDNSVDSYVSVDSIESDNTNGVIENIEFGKISSLILPPPVIKSEWEVIVCNLCGQSKKVIGKPTTPLFLLVSQCENLIMKFEEYNPECKQDKSLCSTKNEIEIIVNGVSFKDFSMTWEHAKINNKDKVYILRRFTLKQSKYLNKKRKHDSTCRSIGTQTFTYVKKNRK